MANIKLQGLEEFQEKLKLIEKKAPDRILNELDKQGKKLRSAAVANTPKGRTGKLKKGYKLEPVLRVKGGYSKGMYNKMPYFGLVERGHVKVDRTGKSIGWTDGVFMLEKTMKQQEDAISKELRMWLDKLFHELK